MAKEENNSSELLMYQTEDGITKIETRIENESVWLTIDQMAELFQKSRSTINEHIINIFNEGELQQESSVRKIGISDFSTKPTNIYNLDVIISVGYRVKSLRGTQFRIWATERLREYLIKGFTMNDDLLRRGVVILKNCWKESAISVHQRKYFTGRFSKFMQQALTITLMPKQQNCFFKRFRINYIGQHTATPLPK